MEKTIDIDKGEIERLGLNAIKEYFKVDPKLLDRETIQHLHNKAKIAMQFEREVNTNKRAIELNYIRIFRMVAEDKEELKKYVRVSMPAYYPALKKSEM